MYQQISYFFKNALKKHWNKQIIKIRYMNNRKCKSKKILKNKYRKKIYEFHIEAWIKAKRQAKISIK